MHVETCSELLTQTPQRPLRQPCKPMATELRLPSYAMRRLLNVVPKPRTARSADWAGKGELICARYAVREAVHIELLGRIKPAELYWQPHGSKQKQEGLDT